MRIFLLALLAALVPTCANRTDPVTGEGYYSPIGNDYESQLRYVRSQYLNQLTTVRDGGDIDEPEVVAACEEVFRKLVAGLPEEHRRDFRFDLRIGADPAVNAYTYGAGFVRCSIGLIAFCEDASELAGILAHELGHNSHDHIGQTIGRTRVSSEVLGLGGILGRPGAFLGHLAGGGLAALTLTKYSRAQEVTADERAVEYAAACGYDPDGLARFFARLDQVERSRGRPPILFQTHPYSATRVSEIRADIAALPGGAPANPVRRTEAVQRAIARAREMVPYYERLNRAVESDDRGVTLRVAREGAEALPRHAAFHFWAGVVLYFEKKPDEALPALRRADRLDSTNFLIPLAHATAELESGHAPEAERAATKLIGLMPALPQGHLIRGTARLALGRPEEAFADFDAALARIPGRRERREMQRTLEEHVPDYAERKRRD